METNMSENLAFYKKKGYLILKNFFNSTDVQAIQDGYKKCIAKRTEGVKIIYESDEITPRSIMSYHTKNETLDHYTRESRTLEITEQLLDSKCYVSQSKINPKAPMKDEEIKGKKWEYHRGFAFWNLFDGMPKTSMVSSFIFLTKQTEENGAVFVLEGSHLNVSLGDIKEEIGFDNNSSSNRENDTSEYLSIKILDEKIEKYKSEFKKVVLEGEPGDLVFMHPNLLHASEPNNSKESRDLMITVYNSIDNLPQTPRAEAYVCERDHSAISPSNISL